MIYVLGCRFRTFKHDNHIYKVFNPEDEDETGEKHNINVIKSLGEKLDAGNYWKSYTSVQFIT